MPPILFVCKWRAAPLLLAHGINAETHTHNRICGAQQQVCAGGSSPLGCSGRRLQVMFNGKLRILLLQQ
jgi:hypothetical protein